MRTSDRPKSLDIRTLSLFSKSKAHLCAAAGAAAAKEMFFALTSNAFAAPSEHRLAMRVGLEKLLIFPQTGSQSKL